MDRQCSIVGFNDSVWHFWRWYNAKGVHDSVGVFFTDLWNQQRAHSRAGPAAEGVRKLKTLQAITAFRFFTDNIENRIDKFGTFRVMSFSPVITSPALACNAKKEKASED